MKKPKLIIDVCHPCEVHHYKNIFYQLTECGWHVIFVAKDKDVTTTLLHQLDLPFILLSVNRGGIVRKVMHLPRELLSFFRICQTFQPDIIISAVSLHATWIARLLKIKHLAFIDTEPRYVMDIVTLPFVDAKYTSTSYYRQLGKNHIRYNGTHELAYLHPNHFQARADIRQQLKVKDDEPFIVCRFVAWKASHDIGKKGMSAEAKIQLVQKLAKKMRVFISSETSLPQALQDYELRVEPQHIHSVIAQAHLYIGEGITMAAEAATLGTPAVLLNSLKMGYCLEQEKCGLLYQYESLTKQAVQKIDTLVNTSKADFAARHQHYLADKIDVTAYMSDILLKNFQ